MSASHGVVAHQPGRPCIQRSYWGRPHFLITRLPSLRLPPAVVFSGFGCAHRLLCDLDMEPRLPAGLDDGYNALLGAVRDRA